MKRDKIDPLRVARNNAGFKTKLLRYGLSKVLDDYELCVEDIPLIRDATDKLCIALEQESEAIEAYYGTHRRRRRVRRYVKPKKKVVVKEVVQ